MAWTGSYLASATFRDVLNGADVYKMGPASSPTMSNVALFNNSVTPSIDTDPQLYATAPWNANEVYGAGWAAGGVALTTPSLVRYATVGIQFGAANVSATSTTLNNVYGCIVYAGSTDYVMAAVWFGGGSFSTTGGTFTITWAVINSLACIWYIGLV